MTKKEPDITISVLSDGKLKYTPEEYHTKKGKEIVWGSRGLPFAIQFLDFQLLKEGGGHHHNNGDDLKRTVIDKAEKGKYKYACAVCERNRVILDANCPAIIIDD